VRVQSIIVFVLVTSLQLSSLTNVRAQDANAAARAYAVQATDIARQVLLAELMKHPERVHRVSMTFNFQLDPQGRPHNIKIVSKTRNPWAADVARRAIGAARFPPIPKGLFQAFGTDLVNIQADFDANAETPRSATFSYQTQINTMVLQAVVPELAKHVNLLKGTVKFSFRLDREGHLKSLKITSSTSNRFVEQTTMRMIRAMKFPPIPQKVIAEQGHDYVDVDSEIDIDRH